MSVWVDTSGIYAVLDRDDTNHERARIAWQNLIEKDTALVTTNYVLVETFALIQRRLGLAALRTFCADCLPLVHTHSVEGEDHVAALAAVMAANERALSFVDTTSFQVMRRLGVREAFAFDGHFATHGFELVPSHA